LSLRRHAYRDCARANRSHVVQLFDLQAPRDPLGLLRTGRGSHRRHDRDLQVGQQNDRLSPLRDLRLHHALVAAPWTSDRSHGHQRAAASSGRARRGARASARRHVGRLEVPRPLSARRATRACAPFPFGSWHCGKAKAAGVDLRPTATSAKLRLQNLPETAVQWMPCCPETPRCASRSTGVLETFWRRWRPIPSLSEVEIPGAR
jgi:hypothetical protein